MPFFSEDGTPMNLFVARVARHNGPAVFIFQAQDRDHAQILGQLTASVASGTLLEVLPAEDYIQDDTHEVSLW